MRYSNKWIEFAAFDTKLPSICRKYLVDKRPAYLSRFRCRWVTGYNFPE